MHIVFTIANNSSVPYFNWFAKHASLQKKHTFTFVALCKEKPKMIEDVAIYGWKCHWIFFDHDSRKRNMVSAFFQAFRLFKKIKPDVVHSHLFDDSVPCLLAARLASVKIRGIVKADTGFHYHYSPKWMVFDRFNNWNATDIIPPSKESEKFILEKEKVDKSKTTMIHHGIPSEIFTIQSEENINMLIKKYELNNKIVIGTVSRLIEWKGYKYVIEAAEIIIKKYPNSVFLFVGEGKQRKELEELVNEKKLNKHIIFTGWMDRAYIPSLYSILDAYVHAASFEPFGFVIPEAMMNGAPVVSTPTGSALDSIQHKENGYIVEYKNSDSLAKGIDYMLINGHLLRKRGQETALRMFEFDVMFKNYIKLYENR